jgi:hypothetical protein
MNASGAALHVWNEIIFPVSSIEASFDFKSAKLPVRPDQTRPDQQKIDLCAGHFPIQKMKHSSLNII